MSQLSIDQLLNSPWVDSPGHLDLERVQRYSQLLDELPPVTVFRLEDQTLLLADGYHRVAAARAAGRTTVSADLRHGTRADAIKFATELAAQERGATNKEAHAAIKRHSGARWPDTAAPR